MHSTTVLPADSHRVFRKILHEYFAAFSNVSVIGEASDGIQAVQKATGLKPDVVLLSVEVPFHNGNATARLIKGTLQSTKVIVTTLFEAPEANVDGFILKRGLDTLFGVDTSERT